MAGDRAGAGAGRAGIDHVVVIMLENRSYDHLLGLLTEDPAYDGVRLGDQRFGNLLDPDKPASTRLEVSGDGVFDIGIDPPHTHASVLEQLGRRRRGRGYRWWGRPAMDGFVAAYVRKIAGHELGLPVVHWERIAGVAALVMAGVAMLLALPWAIPLLAGAAVVLAAAESPVLWAYRRRRGLQVRSLGRLFAWPVVVVCAAVLISALLSAVMGYWPRFGVLCGAALACTVVVLLLRRRRVRAVPPTDPALARNVLRCLRPEQLPVLTTLARSFTVCTRWHCSVPGATWPNRNFLHSGTSDGTVDIEVGFYRNATIFERLTEAGATWHVYRDGMAQVMVFERLLEEPHIRNWFEMADFAAHVAAGTLPNYSFIEPRHDGPGSNSQHPGNNDFDAPHGWRTDFERGERLLASIYQTLLEHREVFDRTMLVITYDEHGGFYDHVPPPTRFPAPDRTLDAHPPASHWPRIVGWFIEQPASRFRFRMLGPRVPAVVVSPLAPARADATLYDHTAIPATVRRLFAPDTRPLSRREDRSNTLERLCSLTEPRQDLPDLAHLVLSGPTTAAAPTVAAPADSAGTATTTAGAAGGVGMTDEPDAAAKPGSGPRNDDFARKLRQLARQVTRKLDPQSLPFEPPAGEPPPLESGAPESAVPEPAFPELGPTEAAIPEPARPGPIPPGAAAREPTPFKRALSGGPAGEPAPTAAARGVAALEPALPGSAPSEPASPAPGDEASRIVSEAAAAARRNADLG